MSNQIQQISTLSQKQHWSLLGLHNYIKMLIIGMLFCYLFRDEIRTIIPQWLTDSSWSHGLIIPVFSLYFVNQRKEEILNSVQNNELKPNYSGLFFLICCVLFYPFNIGCFFQDYITKVGLLAVLPRHVPTAPTIFNRRAVGGT